MQLRGESYYKMHFKISFINVGVAEGTTYSAGSRKIRGNRFDSAVIGCHFRIQPVICPDGRLGDVVQ